MIPTSKSAGVAMGDVKVGGVCAFPWNATNNVKLIRRLKKISLCDFIIVNV